MTVVILMSCYNNAGTLPVCLDSLYAQTYKNWVLLAADDGSKDGTAEILEKAAQGDSRIRVFAHTDNQGIAARLNALIEIALKEYPDALIARMDGDDICAPQRFERQAAYLAAHPDIGVLASWGRCLSPEGVLLKDTVETATEHDLIAVNGFFSAPLLHPSVVIRPEVLKALGQPVYDPTLRRAQDFDLWARLVHQTRFAVLPDYLLDYRMGSDKRIHKENDLNRFRRIIVSRNLERLGLRGKDERWMAAAYALVGFPLPGTAIGRADLDRVLEDILQANKTRGLYNPALFEEKLRRKHTKARRKARWWRQFPARLKAAFWRS